MTTDPVQMLIDAGAIPSSPFATNSRYAGVGIVRYTRNRNDPGAPYVLRRFIPQRRVIAIAAQHVVTAGERYELLAADVFGDAELYWRIADANAVTDPFELVDTLGARILLPSISGL